MPRFSVWSQQQLTKVTSLNADDAFVLATDTPEAKAIELQDLSAALFFPGGAARPLNTAGAFLDGVNGLVLGGIAGNYASTPDSAALDVTGDLDIRMQMRPGVAWNILSSISVTKSGAYSLMHQFNTLNGQLQLNWREGGASRIALSTVAVSANLGTAASTGWVRATLDVDNGASGRDITFFTSLDGATWTQLGAVVTQAGVTSVDASANEIRFGDQTGFSSQLGTGQLFRAQVLDGIGGTVVFDADFTAQTADALAFTESSTNAATVTINTTRYTYGIPGAQSLTIGSPLQLTAGFDRFAPFMVLEPLVVDAFMFNVTTAPASNATVRFGFYGADDNLQPTGNIIAQDSTLVPSSATGVFIKQVTPITLQPGIYLLATSTDITLSVRVAQGGIGGTVVGTYPASGGATVLLRPRTSAAFPTTSGSWNSVTNTTPTGAVHYVLLRWRPA